MTFNLGEIFFYIFFHLHVPFNAHFEEETQSIVFSTSFPPIGLAITNSNNSELRRPKKHQRLQPHTRISLCRIHFVTIYPGKGCFFSCVSCASGGSIIDGLGETGNLDSIFFPLDLCYSLNIGVPSNSYIENLMLVVESNFVGPLGGDWVVKVEPLWMGLVPLSKRPHGASLSLPPYKDKVRSL